MLEYHWIKLTYKHGWGYLSQQGELTQTQSQALRLTEIGITRWWPSIQTTDLVSLEIIPTGKFYEEAAG